MIRARRIAVATMLCLTLCQTGEALAQSPSSLIDSATADFVALNFEGSLRKLDLALKSPGNLPADLVRIYGLRALCYLSLGKGELADQAFTAALSIDPDFRLGPEVSPRFSEPFGVLLKRGVAKLQVAVEAPAEATAGEPLHLTVMLTSDPANLSDRLVLFHRRAGAGAWASEKIPLVRGKQTRLVLPGKTVGPVEWYHEVHDRFGGKLRVRGPGQPRRIRILKKEKPKVVAKAPPAPAGVSTPAWYERWWVWAVVGGVAVAAGTTAIILASSNGEAASHRDFSIDIR